MRPQNLSLISKQPATKYIKNWKIFLDNPNLNYNSNIRITRTRNASHMKYDLLYTRAEDVVKTNKLYTKAENVTKERTASTVVPPTTRGTRAARAGRPTSWGTGSASGPARSTSSRRTAWTWLSRPVKESTRPPSGKISLYSFVINSEERMATLASVRDQCGKYTYIWLSICCLYIE